MLCKILDCPNPARTHGLCPKHYARKLRHGSARIVLRKVNVTHPHGGEGCSVKGCDEPFHCHGYCHRHYIRWSRHGDPLHNHTEQVLQFIDQAIKYKKSACLLWPFKSKAGKGYPKATINGEQQYVHRYICGRVHGPAPSLTHQVAHSCGKGHLGCINPKHLRWATVAENSADMLGHETGANQSGKFVDQPQTCTVEGCDRPHYARGLCNMHWQRQRRL